MINVKFVNRQKESKYKVLNEKKGVFYLWFMVYIHRKCVLIYNLRCRKKITVVARGCMKIF